MERSQEASAYRPSSIIRSASFSVEVFQPLRAGAPAGVRTKVEELNGEENTLSRLGTAAEKESCPDEQRPLVCSAEPLRPSSVNGFFAKKRKPSSLMMTTGLQRREIMRSGKNEAGVWAELRPSAQVKDIIDATPAAPAFLRLEAKSFYQGLGILLTKYCFARDAAFNELGNLHELRMGWALFEKVYMTLANPPCSTHNARGQASSARSVIAKNGFEDAVSFMSSVMASGPHGHISVLTFSFSNETTASMRGQRWRKT